MAFEKMGIFTFNHADQADELNLPADTAKQKFDSRASELKTAINKVVDLLNATTDGASGADNVGATAISGVTGTTVQAQMKSMKGLVDAIAAHLADYTLQVPYGGTTTNVGNAYSIATPVITALVAGMAICIKANADSTGTSTLNWDGKGAKAIKKANGTDVTNLKANGIYTLRYNGSNFILQGEGASGNAVASDLLSGKTASTDAGEITGTMVDNGTVNITPGTSNQSIAAGKHSGSGVVYGDTDLVAANIKAGVNIFGVAGNSNVVDTSAGDATAAQILSGKKAYVDGALVTGSMTNRGAHNITPAASNVAIPAGYHNGSGVVYAIPHSSQSYTTPGTYTFVVPSAVTKIWVRVAGGGGGGGGCTGNWYPTPNIFTAGGGGGGGASSGVVSIDTTPGASISVVVGAGGSPGSFSGRSVLSMTDVAYSGHAGGASSVGSVSAAGGAGGRGGPITNNVPGNAAGGAGGTAGPTGYGGAGSGVAGSASSNNGQTPGAGGAGGGVTNNPWGGGAGGVGASAVMYGVGGAGGAGRVDIFW